MLPMSLQKLLQETEYPPHKPSLMQSTTHKVVMIVDTVSPTPFALLRRANHFQYRDEDRPLQDFSEYEDPVQALTEECRRVLKSIASANQSQASSSKHSTSLRDASWSRFEDIGFSSTLEEEDDEDDAAVPRRTHGLRNTPSSGIGLGRPTTPSWADFLSSGFVDDNSNGRPNLLLPPDKVLPPIETAVRQRSSQSHRPRLETERHLEPGELASITKFDLDEAFWWVWMSSLAPEETPDRKSAFGRCAVIETVIRSGRWLVIEEMVAGAAPEPQEGAYIAEKKSFFSWTRRNKGISRRKSTGKQALDKGDKGLSANHPLGLSKTSIGPDQHARIQAAAAQLQAKQQQERVTKQQQQQPRLERRGRSDLELMHEKTNSVFTLQPVIMNEASPAFKWANKYDKEAIREAYLANSNAGKGIGVSTMQTNGTNGHTGTNGYTDMDERRPEVPAKPLASHRPEQSTIPYSATMPISPAPRLDEEEPRLSEKALEAPRELHPAERSEQIGYSAPISTDREPKSLEITREAMVSPEPEPSPESKKQKKLHKDNKAATSGGGGGGGFRKLFGRNKNRTSKLPENAAADLNAMLQQQQPQQQQWQQLHQQPEQEEERPRPEVPKPLQPEVATLSTIPADTSSAERTPVQTPAVTMPEPSYEPSLDSRAETEDTEVRHEFNRFDQGPLSDQPAFVPSDSDTEDAIPPPIARHQRSPEPVSPVTIKSNEDALKPAVPAQDRWAQIRKNAAERAAQRLGEEPPPSNRLSKATDEGEDTSGEESMLPHRSQI
jgi:hypothetical protein